MDPWVRSMFGRLSSQTGLADMSLKDLIAWGDNFKVNQPQIDAQHEAIFALVIEVSALWHEHGGSDQLLAIVDKLDQAVRTHFQYEESILVKIEYPKLAEHQREHAAMLRELEAMRSRIAQMPPGPAYPEPGWQVMSFLLGLTVGHIVHSDVEYCRHVRDAGKDDAFAGAPS